MGYLLFEQKGQAPISALRVTLWADGTSTNLCSPSHSYSMGQVQVNALRVITLLAWNKYKLMLYESLLDAGGKPST